LKMNNNAAIKFATDIVIAVYSNSNVNLSSSLTETGAEQIAKFVDKLSDELAGVSQSPDDNA